RRSKSGHDRNSYRSGPGCGIPRRQTAALRWPRRNGTGGSGVDARRGWRDTDPAYVPGTVWGTASNRTAKSSSAPCLVPQNSQAFTPPSVVTSGRTTIGMPDIIMSPDPRLPQRRPVCRQT
ncbi:MAG TPA: hypothetical protein VK813_02275, partial [Edaphobacter sp.]|nr:hypothetical protein [Edaphobacter sp.]